MHCIDRRSVLKTAGATALASFLPMAHAQATRGVTATSVKLGQLVPLSGPLASYGVPLRTGTEAYVRMINARGGVQGRKLDLVVDDTVFVASKAVMLARKQVINDGIFALVNSQGTAPIGAVLPYVATEEKIPVFAPYAGLAEWFRADQPVYGVQVLGEDTSAALGRWAAKEGKKNVVVVHIEAASLAKAASHAEPSYLKSIPGGKIELLPVKLSTADYAPVALQIAQRKPDAVIAMISEPESIMLVRELRNNGVSAQVYAWASSITQQVLENAGSSFEGVKAFTWTNSPTSGGAAIAEYREAMKAHAPGEKPDFTSLYAFGGMKVFAEALARVKGPLTHASFNDAVHALDGYDSGIFPPVRFSNARHHGLSSLVPVQARGGQWVEVGKWVDVSNPNW